jgi:hypothetical protein
MHPSGWWIIGGALLLIVLYTISGVRNRHSFVDLWVVVFIVAWLALLLDEDLPPYGAIAFYVVVVGGVLASYVSWRRSRRAV